MKVPVVVFKTKSFQLVSFGVFSAIGSVVGFSVAFFFLHANGFDVVSFCWTMALVVTFFNLFFAKFFNVFSLGFKSYFKDLKYNLNQTSFFQQGGITGLILATIILYFLLDIPFATLGDTICLGGIVIMAFGRIGCFTYGCCAGKPTKSLWGIAYSNPKAKICRANPELLHVPLLPAQLFSSGINFLIFILILLVYINLPYPGLIMVVFFLAVNVKRILIQPLRLEPSSNKIPYRWVAFGLLIVFVAILFVFRWCGEEIVCNQKPLSDFTFINFIRFLGSDHNIWASILTVGFINLIVYGIHGRELGTHINVTHDHHSNS